MAMILEPGRTFVSNANRVLANGTIRFCEPGTGSITLKATYPTDAALRAESGANSNPLTFDSAGRMPVEAHGAGLYRIVVRDSLGNTLYDISDVNAGPSNDELPEAVADTLLGWNSTGTGLTNVTRSQVVIDGGGGGNGTFDISAFSLLDETPANDDLAVIRDTSAGTHKKVTVADLMGAALGDAVYRLSAGQSLSGATETTVQFATSSHDALQLNTYSTGVYTLSATVACRIEVEAAVTVTSQDAGGSAYLTIQKNNADQAKVEDKVEADSTARDLHLSVRTILVLNAADTVRVRAYSSVAKTLSSTTSLNRLLIKELG